MVVVSNTSPLNYLLMIDAVEVLRGLYGEIHVPELVIAELGSSNSPEVVRAWTRRLPGWVRVCSPSQLRVAEPLHAGELHAVSLALELGAERLLIDDYAGREVARSAGVSVAGTIGVLDLAAEKRLVDLPQCVKRLLATNFRVRREIVEEVLCRDVVRRGGN